MTKEAIIHDLREIGKTNSVSSYKRMVCEMAADTIENQAKALNALTLANMALKEKAEKCRWIPVEEKLPEARKDVLLIAHGWNDRSIYVGQLRPIKSVKSWLTGIENKSSDWTVWGFSYLREPIVTHWMPLPEGPEETRGE